MKGNLLIVDDEPLLLKSLKMSLEDAADAIYTATNGIEGLAVLEKENVQCVICDINMPKMNGVEMIKEIRHRNSNVPFIFYTGHGNRELMMEVSKYGAFDFLDKPNLEGLEEVVVRGLALGQTKETPVLDHEAFLSEFAKLLKDSKD